MGEADAAGSLGASDGLSERNCGRARTQFGRSAAGRRSHRKAFRSLVTRVARRVEARRGVSAATVPRPSRREPGSEALGRAREAAPWTQGRGEGTRGSRAARPRSNPDHHSVPHSSLASAHAAARRGPAGSGSAPGHRAPSSTRRRWAAPSVDEPASRARLRRADGCALSTQRPARGGPKWPGR